MSEKPTDFDIDAIPTMEPFDDLMSDDPLDTVAEPVEEVDPSVEEPAVTTEPAVDETPATEPVATDESVETDAAKPERMAWLSAGFAHARARLAALFQRRGDTSPTDEGEGETAVDTGNAPPSPAAEETATEMEDAEDGEQPAPHRKRPAVVWIAAVAVAGLVLGVGIALLSYSRIQHHRAREIQHLKTQIQQMKTHIETKNSEIGTLRSQAQAAAQPPSAPQTPPSPAVTTSNAHLAAPPEKEPAAVGSCVVTNKKNAASSLKECIDAFNAAEGGH